MEGATTSVLTVVDVRSVWQSVLRNVLAVMDAYARAFYEWVRVEQQREGAAAEEGETLRR